MTALRTLAGTVTVALIIGAAVYAPEFIAAVMGIKP